jgi:hypothetical protein
MLAARLWITTSLSSSVWLYGPWRAFASLTMLAHSVTTSLYRWQIGSLPSTCMLCTPPHCTKDVYNPQGTNRDLWTVKWLAMEWMVGVRFHSGAEIFLLRWLYMTSGFHGFLVGNLDGHSNQHSAMYICKQHLLTATCFPGACHLLWLRVSHLSLDTMARHTGMYFDRYKHQNARFYVWSSNEVLTTSLHFVPSKGFLRHTQAGPEIVRSWR